MHETPVINAHPRERTGSRYAQRLRRTGKLPAVIYGHGEGSVAVSVDEREILAVLHGGAHLLNVAVEGGKQQTCLVKELQFGYLGDNLIHVDFARVDLSEEVEVNVHLHFVGEPAMAKQPGAIVAQPMTELAIRCQAGSIPEEIRVDLDDMEEDNLTVSDITLPPGVVSLADPQQPVVQITFVQEEEVGEEETVAGEEEPQVITEKAEGEGD